MNQSLSGIISFLSDLAINNNRVWFAENKNRYLQAKAEFDEIVTEMISQIALFDASVSSLTPKDCTYRIYRDVRFRDKDTPYKIHFGAYIAPHGGRKSDYGGYYFHVQPGNQSFLSPGIWSPQPDVLKALRSSIYDNYDEFLEIINNAEFQKFYKNSFYEHEMLKKNPLGFPKDFEGAYYLKLKHYLVSSDLTDDFLLQENWMEKVVERFRVAYPLNKFLNYTLDEIHNS